MGVIESFILCLCLREIWLRRTECDLYDNVRINQPLNILRNRVPRGISKQSFTKSLPPCCPRSRPWSCRHCLSQQSFYSADRFVFLLCHFIFTDHIRSAPKVHPKVQVFNLLLHTEIHMLMVSFKYIRLQKIKFYNILSSRK